MKKVTLIPLFLLNLNIFAGLSFEITHNKSNGEKDFSKNQDYETYKEYYQKKGGFIDRHNYSTNYDTNILYIGEGAYQIESKSKKDKAIMATSAYLALKCSQHIGCRAVFVRSGKWILNFTTGYLGSELIDRWRKIK